ncbi:MAG: helical backbone metal receptor [Ferruginibacter sp.]
MIIKSITQINYTPKRIVSLVPSQTELLAWLQLADETIGITKFCVHPAHWLQSKNIIGGTKNINTKKIAALQPDLIIANKEENVKEQVEALSNDFPVWVTDVNNLQDALEMITNIGYLTNKKEKASELTKNIAAEFLKIYPLTKPVKTAYLIWNDPLMTIGGDNFINDMLRHCGFENIFANQNRYPVISVDELADSNCELLLLSSEPFPFNEKHKAALQQQLPGMQILLIDGEFFSWYGNRLLDAPKYFNEILSGLIK